MTKFNSNVIIGGEFGMNPWQRGTNFVSVADGTYTADRFQYNKNGTMVHDIRKDTSAPLSPSNATFQSLNSLLVDCTTAQGSFAAGDFCTVSYKIEGYDFQLISFIDFQIGFWVMSNKTGVHCVSLRNAGLDRVYLIEFEIADSMVWQWVAANISKIPSTGTWNFTTGIGLEVSWCLGAGTNYRDLSSITETWQTANYLCTDNQINACDSNLNFFWLDNIAVMYSVDAGALHYDNGLNYAATLTECQRYYEKSYNVDTAPGTSTTVGLTSSFMPAGGSTELRGLERKLIIPKRATPTITWYAADGTINSITDSVTGTTAVLSTSNTGQVLTGYPNVGSGTSNTVSAHLVAESEL
jgi:hypothetical protein